MEPLAAHAISRLTPEPSIAIREAVDASMTLAFRRASIPKLLPPTGYPCFICGRTIEPAQDSAVMWHWEWGHNFDDDAELSCAVAHSACLERANRSQNFTPACLS